MKKSVALSGLFLSICLTYLFPMAVLSASDSEKIPETVNGLPLLFTEDFQKGADRWEPTDPKVWKVIVEDGNPVYSLFEQSNYNPPFRSPFNYSLIKDLWVSDFVLEVKAKQTGKEYGHRDLCFIYGWNDPSHFYYTHIATQADPHANSIFIVNSTPRVSIAQDRTQGTQWKDNFYHTIRITRDTKSGTILVFFDDLVKPIMKAEDKIFLLGRIGVGSFDDTGNFDSVRIWGIKTQPK